MAESGYPSIQRVVKSNNFLQMPNDIAWNPNLSLRAKGLMAAVLAFPEGRSPSRLQLGDKVSEGQYALSSACKELCDQGYAYLEKTQNQLGQWTSGYTFYESRDLNPHYSGQVREEVTSYCVDMDGTSPDAEYCHSVEGHWGRTLEDWIEALQESGCKPTQRSNGKWTALCPCHNDTRPSLSISVGRKQAVVAKCHAYCSFDDIVQFLFPGRVDDAGVYTYCDKDDRPLYRVVRGAQKDFSVHSMIDGKALYEVGRVPYRLPQLRAAIKRKETVWVVEGEKDAETMRRKGITATCNAFGAGKWTSDLNQHFKAARVVIVADKDGPGRTHAQTVANALSAHAASIRIVEAAGGPEVNDATDHFAAGFGMHEFVEVPRSKLP